MCVKENVQNMQNRIAECIWIYVRVHVEHMLEKMSGYIPKYLLDYVLEKRSEYIKAKMSRYVWEYMSKNPPACMSRQMPEYMPEHMSERKQDCMTGKMLEYMPEYMSEYTSKYASEHMSECNLRMHVGDCRDMFCVYVRVCVRIDVRLFGTAYAKIHF